MIAIVCPGQGSQTPGFLEPWVAEPAFREHLEAMSDAVGVDLLAHGTVSDADTIRDTAVAQPLIVAAGLLALRPLLADARPGGVAGHSVGEVTAAVAAGVLSEEEALKFVRARGAAMAEAASATSTGMSAVLGGVESDVLARLAELGLEPANFNGGGQIVAAGEREALSRLSEEPPARTRVIPLQVAGAFHTRFMAPAQERLGEVAATLSPSDPSLPLWTNRDGSVVEDGRAFVDPLVGQVASPVRWDACMQGLLDAGVTGIIEVTPSGALTGLAKRAMRGVPAVAVATPDDLAAARDLLAA